MLKILCPECNSNMLIIVQRKKYKNEKFKDCLDGVILGCSNCEAIFDIGVSKLINESEED